MQNYQVTFTDRVDAVSVLQAAQQIHSNIVFGQSSTYMVRDLKTGKRYYANLDKETVMEAEIS